MLTDAQIAIIRDEFKTDPIGIGYAPHIQKANDEGLAKLLNEVHEGDDLYLVNAGEVVILDILRAMDADEFVSLTTNQMMGLQLLFAAEKLDLSDTNLVKMLFNLIPSLTKSKDAILLIQKRPGSRAEVLLGRNIAVSAQDCGAAR